MISIEAQITQLENTFIIWQQFYLTTSMLYVDTLERMFDIIDDSYINFVCRV